MISFLKGTIISKNGNSLIVENNGIGYKLLVTPDFLDKSIGETIEAYTHLKVADDGWQLFGLPNAQTLAFFELLITVSGVGPKMALTILSHAAPDVLEQAIASEDAAFFTRMSGVGKKTAERIIVELKTKVASISPTTGSSSAYDALISLGYSAKEARDAIIHIDPTLPEAEQIKQALKNIR